MSAPQVLSRVRSAALAKGSAHIEIHGTVRGTTASYVDDSGSGSGRQDITVGPMHAVVVFVGGAAYIQADQTTLTNFFGLSPTVGARGAGKWIAITASDRQYSAITSGVSLSSAMDQVIPTGALTKENNDKTVLGRAVIGVHGQIPNAPAGTLYIAASGPPLPVEEVAGDSSGNMTVTFSNWGESLPLSPPAGAVPLASLGT